MFTKSCPRPCSEKLKKNTYTQNIQKKKCSQKACVKNLFLQNCPSPCSEKLKKIYLYLKHSKKKK